MKSKYNFSVLIYIYIKVINFILLVRKIQILKNGFIKFDFHLF
jgi:hypothetical protein